MIEEKFQQKHPEWDYDITVEECNHGYPYVRCIFWKSSVIQLEIDARDIEECCEIASQVIVLIDNVDYSYTEKYFERLHKAYDKFSESKEYQEE